MKAAEFGSELVLAAVILGAGRSMRMGRPKLLLPWGKGSVIEHLLSQWTAVGTKQIAVVCGADDQDLQRELGRPGLVVHDRILNPAPETGMFHSIQLAAAWERWNPSVTHWAIALGDQPHLRTETLLGLIRFARAHPGQACQPSRGGRPRHPVLVHRSVFLRLAGSPAANFKEFLSSCDVALWESDDPGLDLDIDRPEDYERALKLARSCEPGGLR